MRVISGNLKGRTINFLKNTKTRPLKDSVRENIFNILNHSNFLKTKIEGSNVLDLYSGIGSFGIECISRGSKKVTFVEHDIQAADILKENLINFSIMNQAKLYLNKVENYLVQNIKNKYDIFFLDPPFADINFIDNLKLIKKKKIFKKNHILIIHRERKAKDLFDNFLKIVNTKQYGRSKIIFCKFN